MNLKPNDRAVSYSNKEGDSIAVISGEKKSASQCTIGRAIEAASNLVVYEGNTSTVSIP